MTGSGHGWIVRVAGMVALLGGRDRRVRGVRGSAVSRSWPRRATRSLLDRIVRNGTNRVKAPSRVRGQVRDRLVRGAGRAGVVALRRAHAPHYVDRRQVLGPREAAIGTNPRAGEDARRVPDYLTFLGKMHRHARPRVYLEIGVFKGTSLAKTLPSTRVIGIDPDPHVAERRHNWEI